MRDDYESGVGGKDGMELRVWLRLITCFNLMDGAVRQKLHQEYATTLPRFDVLAQLHREDGPLTMGELSRRLMVTNGNVTGLIDRLAREGLVERKPAADDRRRQLVALTDRGQAFFETMAGDHQGWVADMTRNLNAGEKRELFRLLGRLKQSILTPESDTTEAAE
ncbi:MAG: MarR family transcriptional regulator [Rhodospirillales bacterium]|nr:MarR family transcriptional regulator [Rhodospirillales bacterium]